LLLPGLAMRFFERQETARAQTLRLLLLFA
jgi:hypothetical protein